MSPTFSWQVISGWQIPPSRQLWTNGFQLASLSWIEPLTTAGSDNGDGGLHKTDQRRWPIQQGQPNERDDLPICPPMPPRPS
jgi:hypothetical protein